MTAIGSFYDTYFKLAKQVYFQKWGNPANCLQAKGNLYEASTELAQKEAQGYSNDLGRANIDAMKVLIAFLNQYIQMNCNDDGITTVVDVPEGTPPNEVPVYEEGGYVDESTPPPTEGKSNSMIWIVGAGLIGWIIWNNTKRRRKK